MANNEFNFNNGSFFNEIMTSFEKIKKEEQENNKLNVLILGKTGAGKSTLINTVFGEKVAKTGSGSPITANLNKYEKDGLCIYDSKGLEIKDDKGIDNLKQFIEDQKAKEPSDQIHLVWFCICEANRRIEPQEKELIKFLKSEKFCTILVITKAQQDKDENGCSFKDIVKKELELDDEKIERVRAIAIEDDEGNVKKLLGIKELVNKTYCFLNEGQKNAFARKQQYDKDLKREACKEKAQDKIKYYAGLSSTVALSPIPFSDFPLIATNQCAMIYHISMIYELNLSSKDDALKILTALLATGVTGFAVKMLATGLMKFIPGVNFIGGAINATVAYNATKKIGEFYIDYLDEHFEDIQNGKKLDFEFKNLSYRKISNKS
ncbi:GTP-binding protein [Campylobacter jejuni]|uniref:YcjF family protein n=3 Tax=Campylobacteraceae TaxID=72294 RepID=UPI000893836B|nr:GTPase [Campylobacter jejuni]OEZ21189.1 GTP-binding protein [Campylobacter jejuni]